jgi:hypothetical protein
MRHIYIPTAHAEERQIFSEDYTCNSQANRTRTAIILWLQDAVLPWAFRPHLCLSCEFLIPLTPPSPAALLVAPDAWSHRLLWDFRCDLLGRSWRASSWPPAYSLSSMFMSIKCNNWGFNGLSSYKALHTELHPGISGGEREICLGNMAMHPTVAVSVVERIPGSKLACKSC